MGVVANPVSALYNYGKGVVESTLGTNDTGPAPAAPATPKPTQTMIAPDGTPGEIPVEKVDAATKAGFKLGKVLVAPDQRTVGTVPVDRIADALKAGFTDQQPGRKGETREHAAQRRLVYPASDLGLTGTPARAAMGVALAVPGGEAEAGAGLEAADLAKALPDVSPEVLKRIAATPVRVAARSAEIAINETPVLKAARALKGTQIPADEAAGLRIKVPGRDLGITTPGKAAAAAEETPAAATTQPTTQATTQGTTQAEAPAPTKTPKPTISSVVDEAVGNTKLNPKVPLGKQLTPGTPGNRTAAEVTQTTPRTVAPEKITATIPEEVGKQMGAPPLNPKVPIGQQQGAPVVESAKARLERLYPDSGTRQMVHANDERIVEEIGDDPTTMKAVHDLTNTDLRQALINSGEDMGQTSIGNRKAVGDQVTRQQAFEKLLDRGHSPKEIVKLAQKKPTLGDMK